MKSRVFTPFLAAFAGSLILLIGLFLLQGTQTSRTILSGSSIAQAAQVAATTDLTVTIKADKVTIAANDTVNFTVLVTTAKDFETTPYLVEIKYGDGPTSSDLKTGLSGSTKTPLAFTHKYASVGSFIVQTSAYTAVGTPALDQKTLSIAVSDKVVLNIPQTIYVGQVIPFSVTGTTKNVIYEIGSWKSSPFPPPYIARFPITPTGTLKINVRDAGSNAILASASPLVQKPTITLSSKALSASASTPVEIGTPKITPAPGATASYTYNCGNGTPLSSSSKCTYDKSGTFTARVTATVDYDPSLLKPVYVYDFDKVAKIELGSDSATVTVGGVAPTPTITPTGKSTITIIVGKKDGLKSCGDTTVISADVRGPDKKPVLPASVVFTVTDDDKTEIRSPTDTKAPTTTHFVTTKPGNVTITIKAVLKDNTTVLSTTKLVIGKTLDEKQCTLKPRPSKDGDLRLDGDDDNSKFNDTTKRWLRIILKYVANHPDLKDVQAISMVADPFCKTSAITPSSTISNAKDMGCFTLKIIKTDGFELTSLTKAISFTIELNGMAWSEIKGLKKLLKLLKQKGTGWEEDSSAVIDTSNLKETSAASSTLLLATTNPSLELSTTSTGLVGLVADTTPAVVDTGNKVYLPLILKAPSTATTSTLALTH